MTARPIQCNSYFLFQVEVDLFELMCKVLDQNLFAQVDWARNSYYFKELKVGLIDCLSLNIFHERLYKHFLSSESVSVC